MPELTPQLVETIVAACTTNAGETAAALGRALDGSFTLTVGAPATVDAANLPEELSGPGLAVVLIVGSQAALVLLPEAGGLVPAWCAEPDITGQSKLTTLGQELGMLVLPDDCPADDFKAARVKSLAGALKRGGLADGAAMLPLELTAGDNRATARLVWPIGAPGMVLGAAAAKPEAKAEPKAEATPAASASQPKPTRPTQPLPPPKPAKRAVRVEDLPAYTRSLLRIKVPVVVTLAEKRQPLRRIIELGPGSIIQFDKSCEESLDLEVGSQRVAAGEAVKVGDKFGLRVTSIILPDERFMPQKPVK